MFRFFRRGGGQTPSVAAPNTSKLNASLSAYVQAVVNSGANKANITNVKNKMNAVILAGTKTAVAPMTGEARGTSNFGLTKSWMNLQKSMNSLNRVALTNLAGQVRGAMAALQQAGVPAKANLVSTINKNLKKANAILAANAAANTQIKAFIAATKIANNKNANNQARALNAAYAGLPLGINAVFKNNKAKANAAIAKVRAGQLPKPGGNVGAAALPPPDGVTMANGRYFRKNNARGGWIVVNKNSGFAPSTTNKNLYNKPGGAVISGEGFA